MNIFLYFLHGKGPVCKLVVIQKKTFLFAKTELSEFPRSSILLLLSWSKEAKKGEKLFCRFCASQETLNVTKLASTLATIYIYRVFHQTLGIQLDGFLRFVLPLTKINEKLFCPKPKIYEKGEKSAE